MISEPREGPLRDPGGVCMVAPVVTQIQAGIQRQLLLQTRELARRGRRVFILQRDDPALRNSPALQQEWKHVTFLCTLNLPDGAPGGKEPAERIRGLIFILHGLFLLWKHRKHIDVVHAQQLYSPTLMGALSKVLLGKKLVVKVTASGHMGEVGELRRLPFRKLRLLAFRNIDHLVVLTEQMREEIRPLGIADARVSVIPNSVDLPPTPIRTPRTSDAPFSTLYTGRLSTEKSLETLLGAAILLRERGLSVIIHLVGGSFPERDAMPMLRTLAEQMGDEARVRFHGYQLDTDPFYRSADAFVLPSLSEGMSNSLLEALSYGLPCVVSDIPPNRELVEPGINGLVFPPGNETVLADQLEVLILDQRIGGYMMAEMSARARRRISDEFSVGSIVDRLEALYDGSP